MRRHKTRRTSSKLLPNRFIYELSLRATYATLFRRDNLIFDGAPIQRRENNSPKIGRRRIKLKRNVKSLAHLPPGSDDFTGDSLAGAGMLQNETSFDGQALLQHNQGPVRAYALCKDFERCRFALQRHMDIRPDAEQNALRAAAFLTRRYRPNRQRRRSGRMM